MFCVLRPLQSLSTKQSMSTSGFACRLPYVSPRSEGRYVIIEASQGHSNLLLVYFNISVAVRFGLVRIQDKHFARSVAPPLPLSLINT